MKRLLIILLLIFILLTNNSFAKYNQNFKIECFELNVIKDFEPPQYNIEYSEKTWTNKDVIIKIKFSEEIKPIEDFVYKDGYYIKTIFQNESKSFEVSDLAGNTTQVNYNVNWIDKISPQIIGLENGKKYNSKVTCNYLDNESGIKNIEKIFYGDLKIVSEEREDSIKLRVIRSPKNIEKYRFYRIDNEFSNYIESQKDFIVYKNADEKIYNYYVIAIDSAGIEYKSNMIKTGDIFNEYILENEENNVFSRSGNYDIKVIDKAGNETKYTIFMDLEK